MTSPNDVLDRRVLAAVVTGAGRLGEVMTGAKLDDVPGTVASLHRLKAAGKVEWDKTTERWRART